MRIVSEADILPTLKSGTKAFVKRSHNSMIIDARYAEFACSHRKAVRLLKPPTLNLGAKVTMIGQPTVWLSASYVIGLSTKGSWVLEKLMKS